MIGFSKIGKIEQLRTVILLVAYSRNVAKSTKKGNDVKNVPTGNIN